MRKTLSLMGSTLSTLTGTAHAAIQFGNGQEPTVLAAQEQSYAVTLSAPLNALGMHNMYASHSSHVSHSSHTSHSSHYSSSGGSYRMPSYAPSTAPSYTPPTYQPPAMQSAPTGKPTADQLKYMIMRVQAALFAKGYDPGSIDGVLGSKTKEALRQFQSAHGLPANAKMTTETLNALGIPLAPGQ